jgi:transcription elongation factor GreA
MMLWQQPMPCLRNKKEFEMNQNTSHPMTVNGKKTLQEELDNLVKVEREQVKQEIAEARAHGDLKENAEYHAAKEKQSHLEGRIAELQSKLANAKVVDLKDIKDQSKIVFGATITLYSHDKDNSFTYQIVGEDEARNGENKISYNSPLAMACLGKEEGDEVVVKAPKGEMVYEVESIEYK